jgi:IS5 family transposase
VENFGRPGLAIRLVVGLHYLKYAYDESDESVVERFLENPYWQYFCGFEYFEHECPLDPSSLVRWRKRVGSQGMERLLKETVETAKRKSLLKVRHMERVNVDTTVQEKAVAFPTDARLYH